MSRDTHRQANTHIRWVNHNQQTVSSPRLIYIGKRFFTPFPFDGNPKPEKINETLLSRADAIFAGETPSRLLAPDTIPRRKSLLRGGLRH